jgi:hypothetical protein
MKLTKAMISTTAMTVMLVVSIGVIAVDGACAEVL